MCIVYMYMAGWFETVGIRSVSAWNEQRKNAQLLFIVLERDFQYMVLVLAWEACTYVCMYNQPKSYDTRDMSTTLCLIR